VTNLRRMTAFLLVAVAFAAGCSDEIVCPGVGDPEQVPYVAARVVERRAAGGDTTFVSVFCSADPVPVDFGASVNSLTIPNISLTDPLGRLATREEERLIWVSGMRCTLTVATNYGFAGAVATVPGAFSVSAEASITLGDSLALGWTESPDADYYTVYAVLDGGARGFVELSDTTAATSATFGTSSLPFPGTITGSVTAVSGPFPGPGAYGNVSGAGRGFFAVAYGDTLAEFEVVVLDTL